MRYHALACDYDGTLAKDGWVTESAIEALEKLRETGRKLILVTGRELIDLQKIFSHISQFDLVIAENGGVVYDPSVLEEKALCEPPSPEFVAALKAKQVSPLSVGRTIVATWEPHQQAVFETIQELGLELHVVFNKGAVMVLPSGVNKATGLTVALDQLGLSPHNTVGVGDAENDHAFLSICECAVAVSNALPALKDRVDLVTNEDHSDGVIELIEGLIETDLQELEDRLSRHEILIGQRENGEEVRLRPHGINVLIAGTSGAGKSTLATGFLERLCEARLQYCIIDPEGDYQNLEGCVVLGDSHRVPSDDEILSLLEKPAQNAVINLLGQDMKHRPAFFEAFLPDLLEFRNRTGRPHWLVIDETHHLLPSTGGPAAELLKADSHCTLYITVHPEHVAKPVLESVDMIIAIGKSPEKTIQLFCKALDEDCPAVPAVELHPGEAVAWQRNARAEPFRFRSTPPKTERRRHTRKYAEGELAPEKSFYFRGPDDKLNLRVQNLQLFIQIAEGIDDETWTYHLKNHDYSGWFKRDIGDEDLSMEVEEIENENLSPDESRTKIINAIEQRYTAPA